MGRITVIKIPFVTYDWEIAMATVKESIPLNLLLSPELNERLEQLATANNVTKIEILQKSIALFDVVSEAKAGNKRIGILNQDKQLETEIVGI